MKTLPISEELHAQIKSVSEQLGMTMNEYVNHVLKYQTMIMSQSIISKSAKKSSLVEKCESLQQTVENQKAQINNLLKRIADLKK
jgi:antitoxin component of RelBE/YafQ-DinJ toxin-antitoxin module